MRHFNYLFSFAICVINLSSFVSASYQTLYFHDNETVAQGWADIGKMFEKVMWPHRTNVAQLLRNSVSNSDLKVHLSSKCSNALLSLADGLDQRKQWAIESMSIFE